MGLWTRLEPFAANRPLLWSCRKAKFLTVRNLINPTPTRSYDCVSVNSLQCGQPGTGGARPSRSHPPASRRRNRDLRPSVPSAVKTPASRFPARIIALPEFMNLGFSQWPRAAPHSEKFDNSLSCNDPVQPGPKNVQQGHRKLARRHIPGKPSQSSPTSRRGAIPPSRRHLYR